MTDKPSTELKQRLFLRSLRRALAHLYDPVELRASPLVRLLGLEQRADVVLVLRRALVDAIESLRPQRDLPPDTRNWRIYQILHQRYAEQTTQVEVAAALGLSTRQLQREEKLAREVLADYLWRAYHVADRLDSLPTEPEPEGGDDDTQASALTRQEELQRLGTTVPAQLVDVAGLIADVAHTIRPLCESYGVALALQTAEAIPRLSLKQPLLRQALLNLIGTAARLARGGQVTVQTGVTERGLQIDICGATRQPAPDGPPGSREGLQMAGHLVELCGGTLAHSQVAEGESPRCLGGPADFHAAITLPVVPTVTVLVIDDNADSRQLLQRYLSGSRYYLVGAANAGQGLALAQELSPAIIVLDVMMPEQDGWTLLGQLRVHPQTRDIPVIIYTILAQEELALALGAADCIRKPVSQGAFLQLLARHLD